MDRLQPKSIGALWLKESQKGQQYFTGTIDGKRIVVYANGYKKEPKHPDFVIYEDKREPNKKIIVNAPSQQQTDDIPF